MSDNNIPIEIEALPEGFDEVIDSVRNVGKEVDAALKEASVAKKMLGDRSNELSEALVSGTKALEDETGKLSDLAKQYHDSSKSCAELGARLDDLNGKWTEMQNLGPLLHPDDPAIQQLQDEIQNTRQRYDELDNSCTKLTDSIIDQERAVSSARRGLADLTAQTNAYTAQSNKAAMASSLVSASMNNARLAGRGFRQSMIALHRLMSGDVVGGFQSASIAAKSFGAALSSISTIGLMAVVAAIAAIAAAWKDAKEAAKEYERGAQKLEELSAQIADSRAPAKPGLDTLSDEELANKRKTRERIYNAKKEQTDFAQQSYANVIEARDSGVIGRGKHAKAQVDSATQLLKDAKAEEDAAKKELDAVDAELKRRQGVKDKAAEKEADDAKTLKERQRAFRDRQSLDVVEREAEAAKPGSGRLARLEAEKMQVEIDKTLTSDALELQKLEERRWDIEQKITDEKERQAKVAERAAQQQADWERSRKLDKMDAGDRVSYIDKEIEQLRQGPRNADTEAKMRRLIDERDREQESADKESEQKKKDADELDRKKQDFLHRNDTDAQKLARIGKELGATDDQSKMLELMMAGEDLAENYQEPMTKRQQRRAEKKAERDAKAAMREARKFRKQVGEIEAAWAGGDKSVAEKVAGMTIDNTGTVSVRQMSKDGKVVKVEGQDLTNKLLNDIAKALT